MLALICVQDRQCEDASWFNYVYNIALSFQDQFFSLGIAITLAIGELNNGSFVVKFEVKGHSSSPFHDLVVLSTE